MQLVDGSHVFSATDLVGFLACEHLTDLDLARVAGLVERPFRNDPELEVIRKRGEQHEARYLEGLEAAGRTVTRIALDGSIADTRERLAAAAAETADALRAGADVVYQATFFDGRWRGHADFLLRVDRPSALGPWSYEVADTKLARHVKASAILQICSYIEGLVRIQGTEPEHLHVVLGGKAHETATYRVADFMAYYRLAKGLFEGHVAATVPADPPAGTYPEPTEHCEVCAWDEVCSKRRRRDDHLSLVAGITARQRRALAERGVATRTALARANLPFTPRLDGASAAGVERVQKQAAIQVRDPWPGGRLWELIEPARLPDGTLEPDRGLLALPEPRPGDLFFDIEGDPYASEDGIDYLFGVLEPGVTEQGPDGEPRPAFHAIWSRDPDGNVTEAAERAAFERLMDLFSDRLARDPAIHIYHYAPYEPTALRRLMGRYGTREDEVDGLLRAGTLVDLYHVVRQGIRASVESYSIKRLEKLYGFAREVDLRDAGSSIAAFEAWLQGVEGEHTEETLGRIEAYNRDDVVSTMLLRDWLERTVRPALAVRLGTDVPRKLPREPEPHEELAVELEEVAALAERLAPGGIDDGTPDGHARWLLAQLLWWHRREDKSYWRRWFELRDELTEEERIEAPEPIAGMTFQRVVGDEKQSRIYRYAFPEQDYAVKVGGGVGSPGGVYPGQVVALDPAARTVDLKRRPNGHDPAAVRSIIPDDWVNPKPLHESLKRTALWVAEQGATGPGPLRAARDLLLREPPRAGQPDGGAVRDEAADAVDAAVAAAVALDESYLAIQGPPGSGKTYIGARIAIELASRGRRVGVTANSHKVIGHLLGEIAAVAKREGRPVPRIGQRTDAEGRVTFAGARPLKDNRAAEAALRDGELDVVGGTGWTWSRPEFSGLLDVLVIDEAGQLSLANAVAVAQSAASLVLLGDPQQLDQPLKGSHPPGAERSALAHLLNGAATMPPDRGIFLERTRRLHPAICAFTSEAFYEGRLEPIEGLERQALLVEATGELAGSGARLRLVPHQGNANDSPEEAAAVAEVVAALIGDDRQWVDAAGRHHALELDDILVVTPYNAQVGLLEGALPAGARVGTVDKFQGQEAPVSIYSMATSSQDEAPRGMEFLYSLNRLNVATSRARCVTLVVASPDLLRVRARTPRQMQLANALARFAEHAAPER